MMDKSIAGRLHVPNPQPDVESVGGIGRRDCCKAERDHDLVREYYKFAFFGLICLLPTPSHDMDACAFFWGTVVMMC